MSQPPKARSVSSASGTNFLMSGERASVRLPRRTVPICVSDPTGCDLPLRTSSTPAMKVVLTAPMPGSSTPSFPLAGAILEGFSMPLLLLNDPNTIDGKNELRTRIAAAEACRVPKQTNNDEGRLEDLQIEGTGTSAPCEHLFVGRQDFPDGSVFLPENPGAESLQAAVFYQRIALAERAGVGEKYPFAQVIAIEEKPGGTVDGIPFDAAFVSLGEIQGVVSGDVFRAWVGFVRGREARLRGSFHQRTSDSRRAGSPVKASPAVRTLARSRGCRWSRPIQLRDLGRSSACAGHRSSSRRDPRFAPALTSRTLHANSRRFNWKTRLHRARREHSGRLRW